MITCVTIPAPPNWASQLISASPGQWPLAWLRRGQGMIAWGQTERLDLQGPNRLSRAAGWWAKQAASAQISVAENPNQSGQSGALSKQPGTGLIAFGSFPFDDCSAAAAVLIVPQVVVGLREQTAWITGIANNVSRSSLAKNLTALLQQRPTAVVDELNNRHSPPEPAQAGSGVARQPRHLAEAWPGVVAQAIEAIRRGEVEKVVLARDEWVSREQPWRIADLLSNLSAAYPNCWTFCVDNLVGATPEMLVRSVHGLVTARVLAGTFPHDAGEPDRSRLAQALLSSSKDLAEHQFAVRSVAQALAPFTNELSVPDAPYVLSLANVSHLASDIAGVASQKFSVLELADAVHPTAAVCGTPPNPARQLLTRLEDFDRERYAGPVGWIDSQGDGEWAIALRCAQLSADRLQAHLYAGGGIVAASQCAEELAETEAKFLPMRQALGCA
ncbi:MAG: chorismate-binding protein [Bifidobacteriaceae bacterium]|jgi:menaquinone-specific isochorismate synthase|nr:chorismate-binding protein [Bifidobacteriaceae bacterium]